MLCRFCIFSPTAESFGVSAQIGSGVVWGGPEVWFHEGFTRVPAGFHMLLGISPELIGFRGWSLLFEGPHPPYENTRGLIPRHRQGHGMNRFGTPE